MNPAAMIRLGALAVVLALAGIAMLTGRGSDQAPVINASSPTTAPTTGEGESTSDPASSSSRPPSGPSPQRGPDLVAEPTNATSELEQTATRAVEAWQQPDVDTRTSALVGLATSAYQAAAATIDPTRVSTSPPSAAVVRVEADGQALVEVELEDGTRLAVLLVMTDGTWLLDDLRPVQPPRPGEDT